MNHSKDSLEDHLRAVAQGLPYPPTPDIARAVRQKLIKGQKSHAWREPAASRRRIALAAAALLLVVMAGLLLVPGVRATVIEFLQIGVIRILLPEPTQAPTQTLSSIASPTRTPVLTPSPTPSPIPRDLISLNDLQGETTLELASQKASFTLLLPSYPEKLGKPDRIFLQDLGGAMVVLVWTEKDDPEIAELVIYQIAPGSWAGEKGEPYSLEHTQVNGREAVWAKGPHVLSLTNGDLDFRRLIAGHVLIWVDGGITYRLESNLSLRQAIQIAESLIPIP